jgi:hypothetical protein
MLYNSASYLIDWSQYINFPTWHFEFAMQQIVKKYVNYLS